MGREDELSIDELELEALRFIDEIYRLEFGEESFAFLKEELIRQIRERTQELVNGRRRGNS